MFINLYGLRKLLKLNTLHSLIVRQSLIHRSNLLDLIYLVHRQLMYWGLESQKVCPGLSTFRISIKQLLERWDYCTKLIHTSQTSNYKQFIKVMLDHRWITVPLFEAVSAVLHWDCWTKYSQEPVLWFEQ